MFKTYNYYAGRVIKEFIDVLNNLIALSKKKKQFFILFALSFIVILLESYTLSIVYEASNLIINKQFNLSNFFLVFLINLIGIPEYLLGIFSIISLFIFIFFKNIFVILIIFYKNNLLTTIQRAISYNMIQNFLNQKYDFFINKHSSELISNIQQDVGLLMRNYASVISLLVEFSLITFLLVYLLTFNLKIGIIFLFSIVLYFIFFTLITKKKIINLSYERSTLNQQIIKSLQETFGNFREFIIYNCKKFFLNQLNIKYDNFFQNLKFTNILQQISKVLIEQVFVVSIIFILIFSSFFNDENFLLNFTPLVSVYLFTFIKILPALNVIIIETQSYIYTKLFVNKIKIQLLSKELIDLKEDKKKMKFKKFIKLENISYKYKNKYILQNLNLIVKKNEKIGIIGKSGAGKTTLLNIIMGFLKPSNGHVTIDSIKIVENWKNNFAYVSQSAYLIDDSLENNITLENTKKINRKLLQDSICNSGLDNFTKEYFLRAENSIGERGSKISGGELLRIGLARAHYSQRDIFILDEFTSALDLKTEEYILKNLNKIEKTLIIVSHRKSTLKHCDRIFELKKSTLTQIL